MERLEAAIAEAKRALELDPLSFPINRALGATYLNARDYDQAIEQLRKTLELDPNFGLAHADLIFAYIQKSMYQEALAEAEKDLVLDPRAAAEADLAYAYGKAGRKADAQKILDKLTELSKQKYVQPRLLARVYVGLGDKEKAFEYLEKSYLDRSIGTAFAVFNTDPTFEPLRSDLRFADLLRRMNLQP
jgi:tetratricopeptide (TPR) repeat protein